MRREGIGVASSAGRDRFRPAVAPEHPAGRHSGHGRLRSLAARRDPAVMGRRVAFLLATVAMALLQSCNESDNGTSPSEASGEYRVMAEVERYVDDGAPMADATVVVSRDGSPVSGATVTLNGQDVPAASSALWYRRTGLPFPESERAVTIRVSAAGRDRVLQDSLPGVMGLIQPQAGAGFTDNEWIFTSWEPIDWGASPQPRAITLEFTQGSPFYFVTLPPEATAGEVPSVATSPSGMEFLIVSAWSGSDDPGNLERGDWTGKEGLRLGTSAVTWVEIRP